jgi:glutamyl-tRNA synthetase
MDTARKRPEYVEDIFRVLEWLGLDWDSGPTGPDDFEKKWSQKQRQPLYEETLQYLKEKELLFACKCTRSQFQPDAAYPGNCLQQNLPLDNSLLSWRLKLQNGSTLNWNDAEKGPVSFNLAETTGPFIVRRRDGLPAYQICSVTDDRYFGITHIVRGEDLMQSTAMQLYLDQQLPDPRLFQCRFRHHPLLLDPQGRKFSKSAGSQAHSIRSYANKSGILRGFALWMQLEPRETDQPADWIGDFNLQ